MFNINRMFLSVLEANKCDVNRYDREFIANILRQIPEHLREKTYTKYNSIITTESRYDANIFLLEMQNKIDHSYSKLTSTDDEITNDSEKISKEFTSLILKNKNIDYINKIITARLKDLKIQKPNTKNDLGLFSRLMCPRFWKRKFRMIQLKIIEELTLTLRMINRNKYIYASDFSVKTKHQQFEKNKNLLKKIIATNELGDSFTLQELSDKSVSNSKNKYSEFITRIEGNKIIANELQHSGLFITLICPKTMRSFFSKSGKENLDYDGTTPQEAHKFLSHVWKLVRTALNRRNIKYYGFWVAEPHADGTPHRHFVIYCEPQNEIIIKNFFNLYVLKIYSVDKNLLSKIIDIKKIDDTLGNVNGYLTKYIINNIDNNGLKENFYGENAKNSLGRILAWTSIWGIRQFDFFGNPPISIWRELRRIKKTSNANIKETVDAAVKGDWATFMKLMGGPCSDKNTQQIKLFKVWSDELNYYHEPKGFQVLGIEFGNNHIITRIHTWIIGLFNKVKEKFDTTKIFINKCTDIFRNNTGNNCNGYTK